MISAWNPELTSKDDAIYTILFFKSPYEKECKLTYLKTIYSNWADLKENIECTFKSSDLGTFGMSLGILTKFGVVPNLIPINEFFKDESGFRHSRKISCIVLSSFQECN